MDIPDDFDPEKYGDGCSSWPDTLLGVSHRAACAYHDFAYREGSDPNAGFWERATARLGADWRLAKQVAAVRSDKWWHAPAHWVNGLAMFIGVRVGGVQSFRAYGLSKESWAGKSKAGKVLHDWDKKHWGWDEERRNER